ncbi:MAG: PIG-L family deacetylase [Planctomycetota bacterium]
MAAGCRSGPSRPPPGPFPRSVVASILERLLLACARTLDVEHSRRPWLVVSPHPDDETLGCGCTIARARQAGIPVHVVVVTDGSGHPVHVADKGMLVALRRDETVNACGVLGVPASHVVFLGIPDGQAPANIANVAERLAEMVDRLDPDRIFAPSDLDNHSDHRAVAAAVRDLSRRGRGRAAVYDYPVWFWFPRYLVRAFLRGEFLLLRRVSSGACLDLKQRALACHASQAGAFDPADAILTPGFLWRFLRPYEYFFERRPWRQHGR